VIEFLESDLPIPQIGLAFVYCDHKDNIAQSIEYFLGAIVRQLVEQRQNIPQIVHTLYQKHRGKETSPTHEEYMDALRFLAEQYSEVYIVIDALDECVDKDQRNIWSGLISTLKSTVSNLRLLYTSREIEDIADILSGSTRIDIRASDADIQIYVREHIKSKELLLQMCQQDPDFGDKIAQTISSKAEGMSVLYYLCVLSKSGTNLSTVF
jgi:hypothetical protein